MTPLAPAFALCLASFPLLAQDAQAPDPLGETSIFGRAVTLYEDGTWAPTDGGTIGSVADFDRAGRCITLVVEDFEFCDPEALWSTPTRIESAEDSYTEFDMFSERTRLSFAVGEVDGHGGNLESLDYAFMEEDEGLIAKLFHRTLGLGETKMRSVIYEDFAIFETVYDDFDPDQKQSGAASLSLEIIGTEVTLYADLQTSVHGAAVSGGPKEFGAAQETLYKNMTLGGVALAKIMAGDENEKAKK